MPAALAPESLCQARSRKQRARGRGADSPKVADGGFFEWPPAEAISVRSRLGEPAVPPCAPSQPESDSWSAWSSLSHEKCRKRRLAGGGNEQSARLPRRQRPRP